MARCVRLHVADVPVEQRTAGLDRRRLARADLAVQVEQGLVLRLHVVLVQGVDDGREVLELAGLRPPKDYTLRVKVAGQKPEKVGLDEKVDLRKPGIEKFKALPRDQTEG